jgi:hypothetical protein
LWTLQTAAGDMIIERGDAGSAISPRRPCFYFMATFPPDQLAHTIETTNVRLETIKQPQLTTGELLKFFGVLILGTRHEFGHRADLWKNEAGIRLLQAPAFGTKTGMPRKRFDDTWSSLTFSRPGVADIALDPFVFQTNPRWFRQSRHDLSGGGYTRVNDRPSISFVSQTRLLSCEGTKVHGRVCRFRGETGSRPPVVLVSAVSRLHISTD